MNPTRGAKTRYSIVLDTAVRFRLFKASHILRKPQYCIQALEDHIRIQNASIRILKLAFTTVAAFYVEKRVSANAFIDVKHFGTNIILGIYFCDAHVEAIQPDQKVVEDINNTALHIAQTPQKQSLALYFVSEKQEILFLRNELNVIFAFTNW